MRYRTLDLLPPAYAAPLRARHRDRRLVLAGLAVLGCLLVLLVHSRIRSAAAIDLLERSQSREAEVRSILAMESALPRPAMDLPTGRLLATVANLVPPGITLLGIDLESVGSDGAVEPGARLLCRLEGLAPGSNELLDLVDGIARHRYFRTVRHRCPGATSDHGPDPRHFAVEFEIDPTKSNALMGDLQR